MSITINEKQYDEQSLSPERLTYTLNKELHLLHL
jgi:hypothetical protein